VGLVINVVPHAAIQGNGIFGIMQINQHIFNENI